MIGDNGIPDTPDWSPTARTCPLPDCDLCSRREAQGFGVYPLPADIVLGQE